MNTYELVVIFNSALTPEDQKKNIAKIEKSVTTAKGKIEKTEEWGKKTFSYPVKKQNDGVYVFLKFSLEPKAADELNKSIRFEDVVIRHQMVKVV